MNITNILDICTLLCYNNSIESIYLTTITKEKYFMKYIIYSDGSYRNGIWGAGAVILRENFETIKELSFAGVDAEGNNNVTGEIQGVLEALRYLFKVNKKTQNVESITVYHDYTGLQKWADNEWKRNKPLTADYFQRIQKARENFPILFVKVKAHSNNLFNDTADYLAKKAVDDYFKENKDYKPNKELSPNSLVTFAINVTVKKEDFDFGGGADGFSKWLQEQQDNIIKVEPVI